MEKEENPAIAEFEATPREQLMASIDAIDKQLNSEGKVSPLKPGDYKLILEIAQRRLEAKASGKPLDDALLDGVIARRVALEMLGGGETFGDVIAHDSEGNILGRADTDAAAMRKGREMIQ